MTRRNRTAPETPDSPTTPEVDPLDTVLESLRVEWGAIGELRTIRVHDVGAGRRSPVVCQLHPDAVGAGIDDILDVLGPGRWMLIPVGLDGRMGRSVVLPERVGRARALRFSSPLYAGPDPEDLRGSPWGPVEPTPPPPTATNPGIDPALAATLGQIGAAFAGINERMGRLEDRATAPAAAPSTLHDALMLKVIDRAMAPPTPQPNPLEAFMPLAVAVAPGLFDLAGRFIDNKVTDVKVNGVRTLATMFFEKVVGPVVEKYAPALLGPPDDDDDDDDDDGTPENDATTATPAA